MFAANRTLTLAPFRLLLCSAPAYPVLLQNCLYRTAPVVNKHANSVDSVLSDFSFTAL